MEAMLLNLCIKYGVTFSQEQHFKKKKKKK